MTHPFPNSFAIMCPPGHENGPCTAVCTEHRACIASRAMAAEPCAGCDQPIGFDAPFKTMPGGWLAHVACLAVEVAA